jgi:hypothetical protein
MDRGAEHAARSEWPTNIEDLNTGEDPPDNAGIFLSSASSAKQVVCIIINLLSSSVTTLWKDLNK